MVTSINDIHIFSENFSIFYNHYLKIFVFLKKIKIAYTYVSLLRYQFFHN